MPQGYNLTPINSNIYQGGNVSLDSTPYTKYALDVEARNRARDDAFARSFQDLSSRTTPAGMDGVDVDNFMKRKQEWQDYVIRNAAAYKNPASDNGKVYSEAMRRYNDVLNVAQQSKDKLAALKPLYQIYQDPTKRDLISEQTLMNAHNATLPISDPNFRRFDASSIDFNDPKFDVKQLQSFANGAKNIIAPSLKNKIYGKSVVDAATNSKITPYEIKLSDSDYNNLRGYAAMWSGVNPQFSNYLDKELNNPTDYQVLNQVYKDHFGKDANIQSREDMGTALLLSNINANLKGEEKSAYTNTLGNQITMEGIRQGNRVALKGIPSAGSSPSANSTWVQDMVDAANSGDKEQLKNTASQLFAANPNFLKLKGQPFVDKNGYLRFDYQSNEFDPNAGDKDANGKPKGDYVWKDHSHLIKVSDVNDTKVKAELAAFQQKFLGTNAKVKNTPYYKGAPQQPAKKTIKKSDIAAKASAAGYTVKEYQDLLLKNGIKIIE